MADFFSSDCREEENDGNPDVLVSSPVFSRDLRKSAFIRGAVDDGGENWNGESDFAHDDFSPSSPTREPFKIK